MKKRKVTFENAHLEYDECLYCFICAPGLVMYTAALLLNPPVVHPE